MSRRNMWKYLTQANNVLESLRPLMYISLIGSAPFRMHSHNEVHTSLLSFVAGILHFCFFAFCFFMALEERDSIIGYFFQTNFTRFGDATVAFTGFIVMCTIFLFALFKRHRLIRVVKHFIVVDNIFAQLGLKIDYCKMFRYSFFISLAMLLFNVGYLCISYWLLRSANISPSFVVFVTFALPHINISIMVFKFLCMTHLARGRFRTLNEILHHILNSHVELLNNVQQLSPLHTASIISPFQRHNSRRSSVRPSTPTSRSVLTASIRQNALSTLRELINVHNILCDICHTIEKYFAFPLLAIIAISFFFILFDDFYLLDVVLTPNRVERVEAHEFFTFFFSQMLWYIPCLCVFCLNVYLYQNF